MAHDPVMYTRRGNARGGVRLAIVVVSLVVTLLASSAAAISCGDFNDGVESSYW